MKVQIDKLDLNWAGDGPYARDDGFAGILADVYCCGVCGRVAIRPVEIELPVPGGRRKFTLNRLPDGELILPSATLMPDGVSAE